jgi:hypothetical protein
MPHSIRPYRNAKKKFKISPKYNPYQSLIVYAHTEMKNKISFLENITHTNGL